MRPLSIALAVLCLLAAAPAAPAESLLLAVWETVDGAPAPKPPPAIEGIFEGLFDAGHIVFDTGSGTPSSTEDLAEMARRGGARYVLEARISFTTSTTADGAKEIEVSAQYTLIAAGSASRLGAGTVADSNKGRERDVDLSTLGSECGKMIASKVNALIQAGGGP